MLRTAAIAMAAAVLLAMSPPTAAVNPVFKLGAPTYSGSGCPRGTIDMVTASDGQSVSVLFSAYSTTTASAKMERRACSLMVPVDVLPGITIGIFKADYRGYAYVPALNGSYVDFGASYFFAGSPGPTYAKRWGPKTNDELFISHKMTATSIAWSGCRPATILRINTAISAVKNSPSLPGDDPQISIDSSDITVEKGIEFFVTYKRC